MGKQQQPRGGRVVPLRWTNQTGDAAADTAAADGNCAAPVAAPGHHEKEGPTIISSVLDVVACLLECCCLLDPNCGVQYATQLGYQDIQSLLVALFLRANRYFSNSIEKQPRKQHGALVCHNS